MGAERRRLAPLQARLVVLCETIARLQAGSIPPVQEPKMLSFSQSPVTGAGAPC
jgi:hypothetical protein